MRFLEHLNESIEPKPPFSPEKSIELIRQNCKPFLAAIKGAGFLWRGTFAANLNLIEVKVPRKDREPMNMPPNIHKALDAAFKTKFGWKARSEGIFCTGSKSQAGFYGNLRTVWPIGEFKFIWAPKIPDLVNYMPHDEYYHIWPEMGVKEILNQYQFKKIIELYTDKDLGIAIKKGQELSLKCKQYYSVTGFWMSNVGFRELVA